jgi:hypothetical protein
MRRTKSGLLLSIPAILAAFLAPAMTAQDGGAGDSSEPLAQVSVMEIANRTVSVRTGGVIDLAYANEGVEVKVAAHGLREGEKVVVLVKSQDSNTYQVFPAYRQANGKSDPIWVARDVRLPDEGAQRKRFVIRAGGWTQCENGSHGFAGQLRHGLNPADAGSRAQVASGECGSPSGNSRRSPG